MTKYEPLTAFLAARADSKVSMTFHEVEDVIGARLPPSAFKYRAWWSNNPSNSVITSAWLAAGFVTELVDLEGAKLVFRRTDAGRPGFEETAQAFDTAPGLLARLQAALGGTVRFAPNFDPTAPTGEVWDAER